MASRRRKTTRPDDPPSPRPYVRLVDSYARDLELWVLRVLRDAKRQQESVRADMVDDPDPFEAVGRSLVLELVLQSEARSLPEAPSVEQVDRVVRPLAQRTARGVRRSLLRVLPPRLISLALGVPAATSGELVQVGLDLGGEEQRLVGEWVREGTDLITTVRRELLPDLEQHVMEAAREGKRWEQIAQVARARVDVSRSHMRLIARDQVSKLNGRLTQHLQQKAGVVEYFWRTNRDTRVRATHSALEGVVIRWDSPPPFGHPGQDHQCRCTAEAVIPGVTKVTPQMRVMPDIRADAEECPGCGAPRPAWWPMAA